MTIESETWAKDSNELFDYETKETHHLNFTTNRAGFLYRNKNTLVYTNETYSTPWQKLLDINCDKTSFYVNNYKNANSKSFEESLWIVVKFYNQPNLMTPVCINVKMLGV